MKPLSLEEFQRTSGLSDAAMLWLLRHKSEYCSMVDGQLSIEAGSVDLQALIASMAARERSLFDEQARLIVERFARIISNHLDSVFAKAAAELARITGRDIDQP